MAATKVDIQTPTAGQNSPILHKMLSNQTPLHTVSDNTHPAQFQQLNQSKEQMDNTALTNKTSLKRFLSWSITDSNNKDLTSLNQQFKRRKREVMLTPLVQHTFADAMLNLGNGKFLCVGIVNGKPLIRFHDLSTKNNEGRYYRFVNLNIEQWADFIVDAPHVRAALQTITDHSYNDSSLEIDPADEQIREPGVRPTCTGATLQIHLGHNVHIVGRPNSKFINIRRYFLTPEDSVDLSVSHDEFCLTPTKDGVVLSFEEWDKLIHFLPLVESLIGDCSDFVRCKVKHSNGQSNQAECQHCNPNGWQYWLNVKKLQDQTNQPRGKKTTNLEVKDPKTVNLELKNQGENTGNNTKEANEADKLVKRDKEQSVDHLQPCKNGEEGGEWLNVKKAIERDAELTSQAQDPYMLEDDDEYDDDEIVTQVTKKKMNKLKQRGQKKRNA